MAKLPMRLKYFVDTEFIANGAGHPIHLLSIGVVCEDGREWYGVSNEWDHNEWDHNEWDHNEAKRARRRSGLLNLHFSGVPMTQGPTETLREGLRAFIGDDTPEFWGDYCAYDYVVVSQLMGDLDDWPERWPMYFNDLQQASHNNGVPVPDYPSIHNALLDAREIAQAWKHVMDVPALMFEE